MRKPGGLVKRLFTAQLVIIVVSGITLAATFTAVAPGLFLHHLAMTGEESPLVQLHASQALQSSFAVAFAASAAVAVIAAALLSWFLARRVSRPIAELAQAAETVASGEYRIDVPDSGFGRELTALSASFQQMAAELDATDSARAQLLTDLAHELRTPLATLEAHIDGMEDGVVAIGPEAFQVMRAQVARLRRLAGDIRLVSAAQENALQLDTRDHNVADVIRTACDAASARFDTKGVALDLAERTADLTVTVDPDRIQQVLANLLDNALRHTPTGGRVTLSAVRRDGAAVISVTDTGEGIPADQLEAVFERFHRVDVARQHNSDGGSGLGLTIARAIAAAHGGTLTAHSEGPGRGTTLTLSLPAR